MYNKQLTLATLAAIGAANGFFVNPLLAGNMGGAVRLHTTTRSTTTTTVMMAAEDSRSEAMRRAELEADKLAAKAGVNQRVGASGTVESREVIREAPIIKERIHEHTTEVDKTRIEEERIRTEVRQRVQPIKDERRENEDTKRVDHGLEVNEHGRAGLDKNARDELERRRQEVASTAGTTREADTTKISERPDVVKKDKLNVVEQVVPVIERDVYIPHRVEHEKEVKEIINEKPVVKETVVEKTLSVEEFKQKYGDVEEKSISELHVEAKSADGSATRTRESSSTTRK